jgi:Protein of unknown function (DUF2924)
MTAMMDLLPQDINTLLTGTEAAASATLAPPPSNQVTVDQELQMLEQLDLSPLQKRWHEAYGQKAPARFGPEFLRRAVAYKLQEQAWGGLSRQALLRLKAISHNIARGDRSTASLPVPSAIKPGTRFVREWQGETHEVLAIDNEAFVYRGKTYRSLTVIAKSITGTHQSGPRFFGLNAKPARPSSTEATNAR